MAVVKIWKITDRIDRVINYVSNTEKTKNYSYASDTHNLKTEEQQLVSGINCQPEFAFQQMSETKKLFKKTGGILAFHAYQSFLPGEVTPQTAHEIGVKFAHRMWDDKFEIVVATHTDREHIHNHYVINSVSCVDGKKYNDCKKKYAQMREISDEFCREYGLSVIEKPIGKGKNYAAYTAEKNGEVTKDSIIRRDIDECILLAISEKDFFNKMKARGYTFDFSHKYAVIHHPDFQRGRRLKTLGENLQETLNKSRLTA